jgi:uncharacterized protein YbjT (DUF2867 family)
MSFFSLSNPINSSTNVTPGTPASSPERILITGASGNVGLETIRELMKHPDRDRFDVVAGVRDVNKPFPDVQPNRFVTFDFTDAATFDTALTGVSRLLLVRPPQLADVDKYFRPFVDAMKRMGVRQVIFLSLQGVESGPSVIPHHKIEKLIVESGLPFTFLRPGFFMQNLSTTHRDEIRLHDELFIPAGNGRTSFVDVRDIGAVAAMALTSQTREHLYKGYELTGTEALTYGEVATILTTVLRRKITYHNPSLLRFVWRKWRQERKTLGFALVMAILYTVVKLGRSARLTKETGNLLDRPPITFLQFVSDNRSVWMP